MYQKKSALFILRLSDWEIKCLSNGLNCARVGVNQYIKWSLGQGVSETRLMKEWKGIHKANIESPHYEAMYT